MFNKVTTLTEFLLTEEQKFEKATGSFTLLLTQIENAAKIIASHLKKTGLVDIMGSTGSQNMYGEDVQKLDEFANQLLVDTFKVSPQVYAIGSEELDDFVYCNKNGEYVVFFDPLDGSHNIDVNIDVGTIFSIFHKSNSLLQPGRAQVAGGYILYGPSVIFVYSCGNQVNGFTLDPSIGSFLLSHPNIQIPDNGKIYTINESYFPLFPTYLQKYVSHIKEKEYVPRYAAVIVGDVHRILLKGGIFLFPENKKKPEGKLRLLFEVNPMSYIVKQAGGDAFSAGINPLSIVPDRIDQRVPIVLGSRKMVEEFRKFYDTRI